MRERERVSEMGEREWVSGLFLSPFRRERNVLERVQINQK